MKHQVIPWLTLFLVFAGISTTLSERRVRKASDTLNSNSEEKAAVPGERKGPLGKVFELAVNLGNREYVDFDTASVFPYPRNVSGDAETRVSWEKKNGIDAHFGRNKEIVLIYERSIIAAPVSDDKWNCTEEELMFEVTKAQWVGDLHPAKAVGNSALFTRFGREARSTFVFKTQQGNAGVLQVQDITRKTTRRGRRATQAKVRYWLLKNPTVKITDEQIMWGKPVKGIACAVKPVKKNVSSGEIFKYDILYKNVSEQPVTVCAYPDFFYIWTQLKILNTEGRIVARGMHANGLSPALKLSDFVTLRPGETASVRGDAVKQLAPSSPNEPGRFAAKVSVSSINRMEEHIPGFDVFCKKHNIKPWTGVIQSGPSPFTVIPSSKKPEEL